MKRIISKCILKVQHLRKKSSHLLKFSKGKAMPKTILWVVAATVSLGLMLTLYFHGAAERGYPAVGGEMLISAIPLVGAALISVERTPKSQLQAGSAIYLARIGSSWIRADGAELSTEDEENFARRCEAEAGFASDFISHLDWQVLMVTVQQCLNSAAEQETSVYIVSPGKLSKFERHSFTSGLSPIQESDSVFYMKAKGVTADDGGGWGGVKTVIRLESGVIRQEDALAHFGKEKLLEILGYEEYSHDIEFISEEEYNQDYAHGA